MIRRLLLVFSAVAMVATVCSQGGDEVGRGGPPDVALQLELAANLETFGDCDDLVDYFREATLESDGHSIVMGLNPARGTVGGGVRLEALPQGVDVVTASGNAGAGAAAGVGETRVPVSSEAPVDVPEPGVPVPVPDLPDAPDVADAIPALPEEDTGGPALGGQLPPPPAGERGEEPPEFSGTNVQESGIDEPDLVKTDGRRIVALSNAELHVFDPADGAIEHQGSVELPELGDELFLFGDRAVVLARSWHEGEPGDVPAGTGADSPNMGVVLGASGSPITVVTAVDLSDPAQPEVVETQRFEGEYVSARLHGGVVRLVLRGTPQLGTVPVPQPSAEEREARERRLEAAAGSRYENAVRDQVTREEQRRVEAAAEEAAEEAVKAAPLEAWLPESITDGDGGREPLVDCESVARPPEPSGLGTVTVLTLDAAGSMAPVDTDTVVADAQTVYASGTTLYVGTSEQLPADEGGPPRPAATTALHAFDISDPAQTEYVASGRVRGQLLNQWSLSEHDGHLRVATTEGMWDGQGGSESYLTVLRRDGDSLERVGQVGGLGPGERIYTARFFGDIGFVVTFRQIDPLYALDLSDPENPEVVGELKIPGFSNYLHPVADGRLLGVGQDADDDGRTRGTQLSLFDVSDVSEPERIDVEVIRDGHSAAEHDHRAFLWWGAENLAVIPLEVWDGSPRPSDDPDDRPEPFVGAAGFRVDDDTIEPAGRLSHADRVEPVEDLDVASPSGVDASGDDVEVIQIAGPYPAASPIVRSLVIGDTLYTVSNEGILASALDGFTERGWAEF